MEVHGPAMLGDCAAPSSSLSGLTRQSVRPFGTRLRQPSLIMDARVKPAHDENWAPTPESSRNANPGFRLREIRATVGHG
jgi:hypothetical protein